MVVVPTMAMVVPVGMHMLMAVVLVRGMRCVVMVVMVVVMTVRMPG
jgi:hypothetical protein